MNITAAVLRSGAGPFQLEQLTLPELRPDEALVRVVGAGLCHTDLLPRRGPFGPPPIVLGHETAGVVEAVGSAVTDVQVGQHVVASFDSCGRCPNCRTGRSPYCTSFWALNFSGAPEGRTPATDAAGAPVSSHWFGQSSFATHAVVPAASLVVVAEDLPLALLAPLGCGVLTGAASVLQALAVRPDSALAVIGVGAVGLSAIMAARVAGATTICAVDRNRARLDLAAEFGATHLVAPAKPDALRAELAAVHPAGFDYCLDTTGVPALIAAGVDALTTTGVCGLLGSPQGPLELGRTALAVGRTVRGVLFGDATPRVMIPQLIRYWRDGKLPFDRLVTTYPLAAVNDAERDFLAGTVVKPVLLPGESGE